MGRRHVACRTRHVSFDRGRGDRGSYPPRGMGRIDRDRELEVNARRSAGGRILAVGTTSARVLETAASVSGTIAPFRGETATYLRPGHVFRGVDALVTNFHLPRSSLLVLVSALAGVELIRAAYQEAIRERYRFYSYGDAMLIL